MKMRKVFKIGRYRITIHLWEKENIIHLIHENFLYKIRKRNKEVTRKPDTKPEQDPTHNQHPKVLSKATMRAPRRKSKPPKNMDSFRPNLQLTEEAANDEKSASR
jgi:uncharacterized protein YcbX